MLRHVVMFRWKDDADEGAIAAALDRVRELPGLIGNTRAFALDLDAGVMDGNHDAVIIADFDDAEAFLAYQRHPAHVEVVTQHLVPLIAGRSAVQIALDD
jgi:hypothetical protein